MSNLPPDVQTLLDQYESGAEALRKAVAGLNPQQLHTPAPPGKWSVMQIVCHIADAEIFYTDRMKRVLVEDRPTMFSADPDQFAARFRAEQRELEEELGLIAAIRKHMARILREASPDDFERVGIHSADGPLTLTALLKRIGGHIPHHIRFINEKRPALLAMK